MDMAPSDDDIVGFLEGQHRELRRLFDELAGTEGSGRTELFHELVRLLAVHETAEEETVHPEVRHIAGGEPVVRARLGEEHRAKELLTTLTEIGPDADGFDTLLVQLREDVLAHAGHEEREEFPLLREACTPERLHAMAATARVAESVAPTRPHPGLESALANLVLGPPAAIMDRARDAIRALRPH
jgi:hemerythrin superfamily protein